MAENADDIECVGKECVDNRCTQLVQRITGNVIFLTKEAAVGSSRETAGKHILLELMKEQRHKKQDRQSLRGGNQVGR